MQRRVVVLLNGHAAAAIVIGCSTLVVLLEVVRVDGSNVGRVHQALVVETLLLLVNGVRVPLESRIEWLKEAHTLLT